jgi:transcription-repair coupling factor (superfamily II helicase)
MAAFSPSNPSNPTSLTQLTVNHLSDLTKLLVQLDEMTSLIAALRSGRSGTIDGAWGSSAVLATATLAEQAPQTVLVVLPHAADVDNWLAELACYLPQPPLVFPVAHEQTGERVVFDTTAQQRLALTQALRVGQGVRLIVAPLAALLQPVPSQAELDARTFPISVGQSLDPDQLLAWLVEHGFRRVEAVEYPGECSRRGGIVDVFPADTADPYRLEFFGDEVESIRRFQVAGQRSLEQVSRLAVLAPAGPEGLAATLRAGQAHLCDYLPSGFWSVLVEPAELRYAGQAFLDRCGSERGLYTVEGTFQLLTRSVSVVVSALPCPSLEVTCHLRVESVERFSGNLAKLGDELRETSSDCRVLIACPTDGELTRLRELLTPSGLDQSGQVQLLPGYVREGFRLVELGLVVLGGQQLFHRPASQLDMQGLAKGQPTPAPRVESRAIDSFFDLAEGDYVVHVLHGIARFRGLRMMPRLGSLTEHADAATAAPLQADADAGAMEESLVLEFRDGVLVQVPISKIDLVQKYVGTGNREPELSRFGGSSWAKRKQKVAEAVVDLAAEMLQLQAMRAAQPGVALPPDSAWQREFEAAFPYRETPDQLAALAQIKADMERPRPMDRLICGDVGFGKTELAIRAAFKAIDNGKQVALLVPTTVLAEQHYRTFSSRFAGYPFVVECLSRARSVAQQRDVLKRLAAGEVDLVIGTHRLLSKDVRFADLGLVIIDEEQRFGVEHKEKLKRLRALVDVLTLSATPIPRTLHSALLGLRDISNLETPPPDRLPIETRICSFDPVLIRHAITRELSREGQIFFVHPRVYDINEIADQLRQIVPGLRVVVAHGQMPPDELERNMLQFVRHQADLLVATTIIESGVDIPNANTIFINEADLYGLADLHQLRGRVGRYKNRAYAYLLLNPNKLVTPTASKRLKAIEEFADLGAGFRIAMRDLEIRGAGNLLGTEQSGHIAAVGYELYCELLENAVRRLQNQPLRQPLDVGIALPWPAYLPRDYVPAQKQRLEVYRRLARVRDLETLQDFRTELRDRFGPIPPAADWLLHAAEIRIRAAAWNIRGIHCDGDFLVLSYQDAQAIHALAKRAGGRLRVVDDRSAYYRLADDQHSPEAMLAVLRELL